MTDNSSPVDARFDAPFDYVIVGGGSAGCVLANRLSCDPAVRVCLLEAGPRDRAPWIRIPLGLIVMMLSRTLNWRYYTEPQTQLNGRCLFWPRGKTLGGSSASNAMVYTRGHRADYDHWAALGNPGWSYDDLLPLFKASEDNARGADDYHGAGGPLHVDDLRTPNRLSAVFLDAAQEAGHALNLDLNGAKQQGVAQYQVTQKNGERWSVARAYLHPAAHRPNLTVVTGARANRVLLAAQDGQKRATGVEYAKGGKTVVATAAREVLLSGGAINSPQLLLLSGIGDRAQLTPHGIAVQHALPGVGRNPQDHLDVLVVHRCTRPVSLGISLRTLPLQLLHAMNYLWRRKGPLTSNAAEAGGFIRSGPDQAIPDLQLHFTPAHLEDHGHTPASAAATMRGHGYALHVCDLRPKSRGTIALHDSDPATPARIDPQYLADDADLETLLQGVKAARAILAAPAFAPYRGAELFPGASVQSDADLRAFIRARAGTIYHPVGTCKMGLGADAVVDARLRVHGVAALRVVDASIMPTLIGGNTNAPTVVIAEKAAAMIIADHRANPVAPI